MRRNYQRPMWTQLLCLFVLILIADRTLSAKEPLKVFVLAGQSNMVGHARAHTIATLFASDSPRDRELLDLILTENHGLSR